MNRKGFTLIEILATLVVLAIVIGIVATVINTILDRAKNKTEEVFVDTIEDALEIYTDSDAKALEFSSEPICNWNGPTNTIIMLYETTESITFENVLDSSFSPITKADLVNPAQKEKKCFEDDNYGLLRIFRDSNYSYYYMIKRSDLGCINEKTKDEEKLSFYEKYKGKENSQYIEKYGEYITNIPLQCAKYIVD